MAIRDIRNQLKKIKQTIKGDCRPMPDTAIIQWYFNDIAREENGEPPLPSPKTNRPMNEREQAIRDHFDKLEKELKD